MDRSIRGAWRCALRRTLMSPPTGMWRRSLRRIDGFECTFGMRQGDAGVTSPDAGHDAGTDAGIDLHVPD